MNIAFFDFDGTITSKDSFIEFVKFSVGNIRFLKGVVVLSPLLLSYKIGLVKNYIAKQKFIYYFFNGTRESWFKKVAEEFSLEYLDKIVKPRAMKRIEWHQERGDKVVVVSASLECYLKPWCEKNGLGLIATKLEVKNGILTGKLLTRNCYGSEKAKRIKERFDLNKFNCIYVYGDSVGDHEMIKLANKKFYKAF